MEKRNFSGYDKRITLRLALCSSVVAEKPELLEALKRLSSLGWAFFNELSQDDMEIIYAEFDDTLEAQIKAEFEADPDFLVDFGHSYGVCPLCGHMGIRWLFRVNNVKGGHSIECGSECIVEHGLHVKGAETAEHARKALESSIRRRMRALLIQKWAAEYSFEEEMFGQVLSALYEICQNYSRTDFRTRREAYHLKRELGKLKGFYERTGWLGTEKKWTQWIRLVKFVRQFSETGATLPVPKDWVKKVPETKVEEVKVVPPLSQEEDQKVLTGF